MVDIGCVSHNLFVLRWFYDFKMVKRCCVKGCGNESFSGCNISFHSAMKSALKLVEKEVSISAPWGKIAALTWGDPRNPAVLLCHGRMDVCSGFRPLVSLLPSSFFYVGVDLPGNGRSDHFPKGGRYGPPDYVPTILRVKEHFGWEKFIYIGHSFGVIIGKYFNIVYPGRISRMVEIDPVPAYETWPPKLFSLWYKQFYVSFYGEAYHKQNGSVETAPRYTYEKVLEMMMKHRSLNEDSAKPILERSLEPAGDGLFRLTYDQRLKEIPQLPLPAEYLKELYTTVETPTLAILAKWMIEMGAYHHTPFIRDPKQWPNNNYRVIEVEGSHDVHITNPERIAGEISKFILEDSSKSKL